MPLLTAFVHSDLTRWIPAAGIAEKTLVAPVVRTFLLTAAIGIAMLGIGLGFAIRMASARAETLHELLIDEINHRVKNTLAIAMPLAAVSRKRARAFIASPSMAYCRLFCMSWRPMRRNMERCL
ncbi:MAG: hypothetical protein WCF83_00015, partial [Pseudolabrys sp.]